MAAVSIFTMQKRECFQAFSKRLYSFLCNACVFGLGIAVFRLELLSLLSAVSYYESARVIPLLICSGILYGTYYVFSSGLLISGKTVFFPLITLSAALLNILLNIAFIPAYGIVGAGLATVLTNFVMAVTVLLLSNRYYAISFHIGKILFISCIGLFAYAIHHYFQQSFSSSLLLKSLLLVGFGLFLYKVVLSHGLKDSMKSDSTKRFSGQE